jgi:hypothetical protein
MAVDFATLGLRLQDEATPQLLRFRGAAEQAAAAGARLSQGTNTLGADLLRAGTAFGRTAETMGVSAEGLGKRLEHMGVMGAFAIANLANGSEQGVARFMHSIAMMGFAFGAEVGAITTGAAVLMEQMEKLWSKEEERAKEFGKNLVEKIREGEAEALAKQQKVTLLDLIDAKAKVAQLSQQSSVGLLESVSGSNSLTTGVSLWQAQRAALAAAKDDVKRLRDEYQQLDEALGKAATRQEQLASRSRMGTTTITAEKAAKDEATYVRELTKSYEEKAAAVQRELGFYQTHQTLLLSIAKGERELAAAKLAVVAAIDLQIKREQERANGYGMFAKDGSMPLKWLNGALDPGGAKGTWALEQSLIIAPINKEKNASLKAMQEIADARAAAAEAYIHKLIPAMSAADLERIKNEEQARENALKQFQEVFGRSIAAMLDGSLHTWTDFFGSVAQLGSHLIGDALAAVIAKRSDELRGGLSIAVGGFGAGYGTGQALGAHNNQATGALAGAAMGAGEGAALGAAIGPIGAAAGAVIGGLTGLIGGFFGAGAAAKKAREEAERLAEAQRQQAETARRAAEAAKAAAEWETARTRDDLTARNLRVAGMDKEAAAQELWNRQVQEFADAVRRGVDEDTLAFLARTQEHERQALAAKQAADAEKALADAQKAQAEAAARAAQELADAQERARLAAQQMAFSVEDLGIRLLKAQGQSEEAARRAFDLQQRKERMDVENQIRTLDLQLGPLLNTVALAERSGLAVNDPAWFANQKGQRDIVAAQLAALTDYLRELTDVQGAEKTAFLAGQSMPGASATPGTQGSFNTIVSRATAEQGDRIVDELTTTRTLQQTYLPYLQVIAQRLSGGINSLLGSALTGSQALAGSAVVS